MRKKWMRAAAAMLMSALMLTTPACAAAPEETPAESAPQAEIVREGGLAYVPDRSVYFADVNVNYSWAFHAIDYLANTGVVSGTGNLIYSPGRSLSRADFILMLYRAYDMEKYASGDNFPDVPDTAYYADAVRAARAIGIATGDEKGNFNPSQTLTRQDAMVLLKRTLDRTGLQFTAGSLAGFSERTGCGLCGRTGCCAGTGGCDRRFGGQTQPVGSGHPRRDGGHAVSCPASPDRQRDGGL